MFSSYVCTYIQHTDAIFSRGLTRVYSPRNRNTLWSNIPRVKWSPLVVRCKLGVPRKMVQLASYAHSGVYAANINRARPPVPSDARGWSGTLTDKRAWNGVLTCSWNRLHATVITGLRTDFNQCALWCDSVPCAILEHMVWYNLLAR